MQSMNILPIDDQGLKLRKIISEVVRIGFRALKKIFFSLFKPVDDMLVFSAKCFLYFKNGI
jgi:hypothetical protein